MPKDEFDFEDPMELAGVVVPSEEETTTAMCECFIEEFMRLGYDHQRILELFKNPYYIGMHMIHREKGEEYVRRQIADVFLLWGKQVDWNREPVHIVGQAIGQPDLTYQK